MTTQASSTENGSAAPIARAHHAGHDIEAGVLARARSWVDVFGWIRLGRVLRVAGSPVLFAVVALTTAVWLPVWNLCLDRDSIRQLPPISGHAVFEPILERPLWCSIAWTDVVQSTLAVALFAPQAGLEDWLRLIAAVLWSIAVWAPAAMILQRQGAVLTAGRPMLPLGDVFLWAMRRYTRACAAAIVPALCVGSLVWLVPLIGALASWRDTGWLTLLLSFIIACVAIPSGLLAFGSAVAVPISWAALINERDPDPLDSLSRGYEYLYRRPLRLLGYLVVSLTILVVLSYLATLVVWAGHQMIAGPLQITATNEISAIRTANWLNLCPLVLVYSVSWALLGGTYLLLRGDAGGQEVEDLWMAPARAMQPLPELKSKT